MVSELATGDILEGKYAIGPRLGEGGMGVVYQAEHISLGIKVAIKVLHPTEADDPTMIERFKTEARSAAAIRHQNVVEVTDFGLTPDRRPFFVMSYLRGESLAERLDRRQVLTERETVEIADQILGGLAVAHRRGVVHRDLKPENVFISKGDDGRETVKLLDFGIAKILGGHRTHPGNRGDGRRQLTLKGTVLGTPGYMAPESIEGDAAIDGRADLFAVGVLMYEMLTGVRPFSGSSPLEIMSQTVARPPARPTAIRRDISDAMERLILTSLAKDPSDRYQTTEEFAHHLTAAAVGRIPDDARPCRTRVGMPSAPPAPFPGSRAAAVYSGDVETAALAGPAPQPRPVKSPRAPAASRPLTAHRSTTVRRSAPLVVSPLLILFLLALGGAAYYLFFYESPVKIVEHDSRTWFSPVDGDDRPSRRNDPVSAPPDSPSPDSPSPAGGQVILWLEISPPNATVLLDGEPTNDRPLTVPVSLSPLELRVSAPGYAPHQQQVIPDREQTLRVRLEPQRRPSKRSKH